MKKPKRIYCTPEEADSLIAGRRHVLRQVIDPQPVKVDLGPFGGTAGWNPNDWAWHEKKHTNVTTVSCKAEGPTDWVENVAPWKTGDRLWVKELVEMKRVDARLHLEIISIRIEQLQAITQEAAELEGYGQAPHRCPGWESELRASEDCFICAFKMHWTRQHGGYGYGWDKNPWVWVIQVKPIVI